MPAPYPDIKAPLLPHQIEDALADLAVTFPTLCTRTVFAGKTFKNKSQSYIKIAKGGGVRPAVLVTGGVHAREWAPPDALVTLARNLLVAYTTGADIGFPAMAVTPVGGTAVTYKPWAIKFADVKGIVENLDLYLFPLVNPDGREFDLTPPIDAIGWRKNVSPQAGGNIGVDLNRNFDIIWKFEDYFDVPVYKSRYGNTTPASTDPAADTYRGPGKHSEQETKNVESLLDTLPIGYYVDVHMAGRNILYSWGLEENGDVPTMTFQNAVFNGTRDGLPKGDSKLPVGRTDYQEYLPDDPPHRIRSRGKFGADIMRDAILRSAGGGALPASGTPQWTHSLYVSGQSAFLYLPVGGGPNSGCSDDYACSRQFLNPARQPLFAYTLEMGHLEEQFFHCDYRDVPGHFRKINREIHAALFGLFKVVVTSAQPTPPEPPLQRVCLIATATLGDPAHPDVRYLRHLRDERLRATPAGAKAADLLDRVYYSFSPAVARHLEGHPRARAIVRALVIRPLVAALRRLFGPMAPDRPPDPPDDGKKQEQAQEQADARERRQADGPGPAQADGQGGIR
ncbi:M14 family zinc carboxypeptidase [Streptosporangium soli]|nr:hypothetical protein [Streptosporangium sp. KLBMP 9127]